MEKLNFKLLKWLNNSTYCVVLIGLFAWAFELDSISGMQGLTLFLYFVMHHLLNAIYDGYTVNIFYASKIFYSQGLSIVLTNLFIYMVMFFVDLKWPNLVTLSLLTGLQLVLAYTWYRVSNSLMLGYSKNLKAAIVYANSSELIDFEEERALSIVSHIRFLRLGDNLEEILQELEDIDVVYTTSLAIQRRREILSFCLEKNIMVFFKPEISEVILGGAKPIRCFNSLVVGISRFDAPIKFRVIKRLMDVLMSLAAILLLSPLLIITALAIRISDKGPALYLQTRLTRDGRPFTIYKFRSMRMDAERDGRARLASENDDRITPVGKIIRRIRFDELPQLFNILKGDMSVVGPRPERPEIMKEYLDTLPEFALRLQVKAGLTGYAQIYGRYDSTPEDKLNLDLYYIGHPSIVNELRIIVATVKVLFMKESTRGVETGQITAERKVKARN